MRIGEGNSQVSCSWRAMTGKWGVGVGGGGWVRGIYVCSKAVQTPSRRGKGRAKYYGLKCLPCHSGKNQKEIVSG